MKGNEMNDTKEYTDGTVVTGTPPFPSMSPKQQAKHDALSCLNDIESLLGGKNGPSIRLRSFIEAEAVQVEPVAWLPIETAPMSGKESLFCTKELGQVVMYWDDREGKWETGFDVGDILTPTHWMPLPAAPKAKS